MSPEALSLIASLAQRVDVLAREVAALRQQVPGAADELSTQQVLAVYAGKIARSTLFELAAAGRIAPHKRPGRRESYWRREDLERLLTSTPAGGRAHRDGGFSPSSLLPLADAPRPQRANSASRRGGHPKKTNSTASTEHPPSAGLGGDLHESSCADRGAHPPLPSFQPVASSLTLPGAPAAGLFCSCGAVKVMELCLCGRRVMPGREKCLVCAGRAEDGEMCSCCGIFRRTIGRGVCARCARIG